MPFEASAAFPIRNELDEIRAAVQTMLGTILAA